MPDDTSDNSPNVKLQTPPAPRVIAGLSRKREGFRERREQVRRAGRPEGVFGEPAVPFAPHGVPAIR